MRIIAGKYKGRKLSEFEGESVRPTSDRAREGLFSVIQFEIADSRFLDGFSGSGAVGIEALSRGAKEVVFTDSSRTSCELTRKNLKLVGESAKVLNIDCVKYLSDTCEKFDIVFLDPPYKSEDGLTALKIIGKRDILNDGGLAVIERGCAVNQPIDGLFIEKHKKYGIAEFAFYRKTDKKTCVFAGSFDPVTNGHVQVVKQAKAIYDNVIVALGKNENKQYTFDKFTRLKMLEAAFSGIEGVAVTDFDGLLVDFLKSKRVTDNVRGIRNDEDMAYEERMYDYNKKLYPEIKNVYLHAEGDFCAISSTKIREMLKNGEDVSVYLPEEVAHIATAYLK